MLNKKIKSISEILVADFFWGFGFIATAWTLTSFSVVQSLYLRFMLITVTSVPFILNKTTMDELKTYLKISFLPGLFLIGEILFQILGVKYTTPSKAGFITTLFIVIVPILEKVFLKRAISKAHWVWVTISLVGMYLILGSQLSEISRGDGLILVSAVFASFHILIIGSVSQNKVSLFKLNLFQSYWACLLTAPLFLFDPLGISNSVGHLAIIGLLSLTFGTTLLAFYFQMRAQKNISPSVASLLFLIEAPLAAFFSFYLLNEKLSLFQILGCVIVLLSASGVILTGYVKKIDPESQKRIVASALGE